MREQIYKRRLVRGLIMEEHLGRFRLKRGLRAQVTWACQRGHAMAILLGNRDVIAIVVVSLALSGVLLGAWALIGELVWLLALPVVLGILLSLLVSQADIAARQVSDHSMAARGFRQLEALSSLFSIIKIQEPLPAMTGWAISPDFANVIVSLIHEMRPETVIEAGSGVSTLITGYCLSSQGRGRCLSLEHDDAYAAVSARNIERHGLQQYASVAHAPLEEVILRGQRWLWYSLEALESITTVDMVIIDGPPGPVQSMARYPALPILFDKLSDGAVIVLDDCSRQDEQRIVERWIQEYPFFSLETVDTERGAIILRKRGLGVGPPQGENATASSRAG